MTAFKNTIAGKILKGVSKVIKPVAVVAGSVLGLGALSGVIKGTGAAAGALGVAVGAGKVLSKVGTSAVNLVTGTTKEEREQVKDVKAEAKAAQDKLDQVERLVKAGATRAKAMQLAGVTAAELGSADADIKDQASAQNLTAQETALKTASGCCVLALMLLTSIMFIFIFFSMII